MNEKIQELLNQRKELLATAEEALKAGDVTTFDAKEKEIQSLDANIEELQLKNANLNALKDNQTVADLSAKNATVANDAQIVATLDPKNNMSDDDLYQNAWAKDMMGLPLSNDEKLVFDNVNTDFRNAYTHDTSNTAVLIPNTVVAGIFSRAEEAYPFFGDAKKFAVPGKLSIKKHTAINAGDATWYDEDTPTADEQNTFGELILDGHELSKAVTVSWKLRAMAVKDFIDYITNELAERVGVALGVGALRGTGTSQPQGLETALTAQSEKPQIKTYAAATGIVYADITALIAKVHSSYLNGAAFYASNKTIWEKLANIVDGNGRPVFIPDATSGGVGRMFGYVVKPDAGVSEGNIAFGNPNKGYVVNTNEPFSVTTETHAKARTIDYVAYTIVDGGVLDEQAFGLLTPTV
ncbi:MAG: phage major capsid protein [Lysinibacillus sp.]